MRLLLWPICLAVSMAALGVGLWLVDRLCPPDLARLHRTGMMVVDNRGEPLRLLAGADGVWRLPARLPDVDPRYVELLLAYEDKRFWSHFGVDPLAVTRATVENLLRGRTVSGASTLTMQVARLLHPHRRDVAGKLGEMLRALQLEWRFSKEEILSIYLTLAPFGGNIEGVRMASWLYFGRDAKELLLSDIGLLISLPQSPTRRRPDRASDRAREGRDTVLLRLREIGRIDTGEATLAFHAPVPSSRMPPSMLAPHIAERARRQDGGTGVVKTTIDAGLQRRVEKLVRAEAEWFDDPATIAVVVAEVKGRKIRAYVGGHDFTAPQGQVDMVRALRSPGSALKPFVYAVALESGLVHPETLVEDGPTRFGDYSPRNFDRRYQGAVTVREALQQSLNIPAVAILRRVGAEHFYAELKRIGYRFVLPQSQSTAGLAVALGGLGADLEGLVALYATLADGGVIDRLRFREDEIVSPPGERLFDRAAAAMVLNMLSEGHHASGARSVRAIAAPPIAFKTGTSFGFRDAWSIGVTSEHVIGVWVGRPDGTPRPGAFGRNTAAPIMFRLFDLLGDEDRAGSTIDAADHYPLGPHSGLPPRGLARVGGGSVFRDDVNVSTGDGPRILFPPPNVEFSVSGHPILVLAKGGTGPLSWYVDGEPLASRAQGQEAEWAPGKPGFYRLSVIDTQGRSAQIHTRLNAESVQ